MGIASHHFRHVLRRLGRSPMFTLVTLLTVAIGVGANSVIFSVINGVLLKPLPYPNPDELVALWESAPNLNLKDMELSPSDYYTFRDQNRSFSSLGIYDSNTVTITGTAAPEQIRSLMLTEGMFPTLGITPELGRVFNATDTAEGS